MATDRDPVVHRRLRFSPARDPALGAAKPHEVEVWLARTDLPESRARELEALLSSVEMERAARFRFVEDRRRFVIGRGMIRSLIAARTDVHGSALPIANDELGRPRFRAPDGKDRVHFSVSHAGEYVAVALADEHAVGVDVEPCRDDPSLPGLVAQAFAPAEREGLKEYSGQGWLAAVYSTWTRKECLVKALGVGLTMEFASFEVSVGYSTPPRLLRSSDSRLDPAEWTLYDLELPAGAVGALAVRGSGTELSAWEFR